MPTTTRPSQNQPGTPAANKAGNQQNGGGEDRALQKRENVFERLYKSATPKRTAEERQPRPAVRSRFFYRKKFSRIFSNLIEIKIELDEDNLKIPVRKIMLSGYCFGQTK